MKTNDITIDRLMFLGFCGTFFFIPVAKSPFIILGLITLSVWIFSGRFIKDRQRLLQKKYKLLPVMLLMLLPWAGLLYTEDISTGLKFAESSYYWLYAFAIFSMSSDKYKPEYLLKAFLLGVSFTASIVILQVAKLIPMKYAGMPTGLLSGGTSHGTLSLFLVFGILVLSFYFKKAKGKRERILIILLMLLNFIALSLGLGRNGQLIFAILSPMIIYNLVGKKHLLWIVIGTILAVVILSMSPIVQERFKQVISDINQYVEGNVNTSLGLRFYMWKVASNLFLKNPVIGSGTGGFGVAWKQQKPGSEIFNFDDPHNTYFYVLANYGIIGVVFLIWYLIVMFKSGWRYRDNIIGFSILSISLVFLIGSMTSTLIVGAANNAWISVSTGLMGALYKNKNEDHKNI